MKRRIFRAAIAICLVGIAPDLRAVDSPRPSGAISEAGGREVSYDVVVYGGTSGGVVAAIQAARMGKSAVLVEPGRHLGGLTSGGLGATDIGNKAAIGGIAREFYRRVANHYARDDAWTNQKRSEYLSTRQHANEDTMWTFEPHVAEEIYRAMIHEAGVPVVFGDRLVLGSGVTKKNNRITAIRLESGKAIQAARMGKSAVLVEPGSHLGGVDLRRARGNRHRQQSGHRRNRARVLPPGRQPLCAR